MCYSVACTYLLPSVEGPAHTMKSLWIETTENDSSLIANVLSYGVLPWKVMGLVDFLSLVFTGPV